MFDICWWKLGLGFLAAIVFAVVWSLVLPPLASAVASLVTGIICGWFGMSWAME